ncbi:MULTISPECIES: ketoacyl-ACP synthase III family protein [unclassified Streptomyces]|uniref:ketoacyl-ACP synthase III family protein n=1 Tax=unclassified Streptomyces TaxID=2593676 RepID=UPI00101050BC|nr:ketoacyl-ACP synthase III family protein [Streptomyces sp. L2]
MRWDDMHVAAVGTWLPEPVQAADAVREGRYTKERYETFDYASVLRSEDVAPPDMAVFAAETALKRSGVDPSEFSLLLHGSLWFQGLDIWPAASYIAQRTVGRHVPAMDVQQRCNIGVSGIELAAAHLTSGLRGGSAVMLTTADRWSGPAVNRWGLHDMSAYGDGGTAVVVSRRGGFARLLATATAADNSLEGLTRGDEPFRTASPAAGTPVDLTARSAAYAARHDEAELTMRIARTMLRAKKEALADAGLTTADLAKVVTPATGRRKGDHQVHHLLGVTEEQTTWSYGRTTGHVGGGDWAAGLAHLIDTRAVAPGDHVMLFGGGAGYTCTAAVLEITEVPQW